MTKTRTIESYSGARMVQVGQTDIIWTIFYIYENGEKVRGRSFSKHRNFSTFSDVIINATLDPFERKYNGIKPLPPKVNIDINRLEKIVIEIYNEKENKVIERELGVTKDKNRERITLYEYIDGKKVYPR